MPSITLALPKGRMFASLVSLLARAGLGVAGHERSYRPQSSDPRVVLKVLKPQNIPPLVELDDVELEPVRLVLAGPPAWRPPTDPGTSVVVASEYERITRSYLDRQAWSYRFVRSYGATEVFPPEDADLIVDNSATGRTLSENGLTELAEVMRSTTRFIASEAALARPEVREFADDLVLLMRGVRAAESRVILEMNVTDGNLEAIVAIVPAMKNPTIARLADGSHALKAAVPQADVPRLIPRLKALGATDILEYPIRKVIP